MIKTALVQIKPLKLGSKSPFLFRYSLMEQLDEMLDMARTSQASEYNMQDAFSLDPDPITHGVLRPILALDSPDEMIIVDGHRRMFFAYKNNLFKVPVLLYPEQTPKEVILHLFLSSIDIMQTSGIEKLIALRKCSLFAIGESLHLEIPIAEISISSIHPIILQYAEKLFGRAISSDYLLSCFEVLSFSHEELRFLNELNLSVEQIHPLSELGREERLWILRKKSSLLFSASQMRKLSRLLLITSAGGKFDFMKWSKAIDSEEVPPESGEELFDRLRTEIIPELRKREIEISTEIKKMRFPSSLKLTQPEDLEGNSFSCYFSFSSEDAFERNLQPLIRAYGDKRIKKILDLLNSCKEKR